MHQARERRNSQTRRLLQSALKNDATQIELEAANLRADDQDDVLLR